MLEKIRNQNNKTTYQITKKRLIQTQLGCMTVLCLVLLLGSIILPQLQKVSLGVLIGGLGGVALIYLMAYSIEKAIERDPQSAQKYMVKHYFIRALVMVGLLLIGVFNGRQLLLGIFMGILLVKISGLLQPGLERLIWNK